jgi:hypothetical protein
LLSDEGSTTIRAWGIVNTEATGRTAGIPHPGTFMIDRAGVIVSRSFEQPYAERRSAASVLASLPAAARPGTTATVRGRHVTLTVGAGDAVVAPGERVSLVVRVTPDPEIHVYAPGQQGYIPIHLAVEPDAAFRTHPIPYPAATPYTFVPLAETVQVYSEPFTLRQDITVALTPELRQRATAGDTLAIRGALEYQACDDTVCYRPETLTLEWHVRLTPLVP